MDTPWGTSYAAFNPAYVLLLLGITAVTYVGGVAMDRPAFPGGRRAIAVASIGVVLGTLVLFKYADFIAGSIDDLLRAAGLSGSSPAIPRLHLGVAAGLSFYAFSCIGYLADVYTRRLAAERHAGYLALYVAFFPKLLAGPIERAGSFLAQLRVPISFNDAAVTAGLRLLLWGLFKKVVIADRLAGFVDAAYAQPSLASPADLFLGTYFFAFQLYCDFSGYSDIAIGTAAVLGFNLMENFRRPYFALSVGEFWARRWHLSLTSWFRDYVYIPLGGNRVSRLRQAINVLTVFLLSGLWHGANWTFVVWGGLNGVYQVASGLTGGRRGRVSGATPVPSMGLTLARRLIVFHLVLISWVFFRASSLSDAFTVLARVAGSGARLPALVWARLTGGEVAMSIVLIVLLLAVEAIDEKRSVWERLLERPVWVRWTAYYALIVSLIVLGTWNQQQFVYMQF